MANDPFVRDNPEIGLLSYLYSFLGDTNALDVGANVGQVSEHLLEVGYTVHAFEPYAPAFGKLEQRLGNRTNFHAFEIALGPADRTMDLHIASDSSGDGRADASLYGTLVKHPMLEHMQFIEHCAGNRAQPRKPAQSRRNSPSRGPAQDRY
ncbi:MAG: FkbM family methyltransferase [Candidatus Binataceae bacterium]